MAKRKVKKNRLPLLLALLLILAAATIVYIFWHHHSSNLHQIKQTNTPGADKQTQAAAEKNDVEVNKQQIANEKDNPQNSQPATPASNSTVVITYAAEEQQTVKVSSYVTNVFEDGGTCTLTLTKDSVTVTREQTGLADATHTTCPTFSIDNSSHTLSSGTWSAKVDYKSATHNGSSETKALEVK